MDGFSMLEWKFKDKKGEGEGSNDPCDNDSDLETSSLNKSNIYYELNELIFSLPQISVITFKNLQIHVYMLFSTQTHFLAISKNDTLAATSILVPRFGF